MKKPLGLCFIGILYLVLGAIVIIGYIFLTVTDWSIFTFGPYDAGDVIYTAQAAETIAKLALAPCLFIGGVLAVPGAVIILQEDSKIKAQGYYLILLASVAWTLPLIGVFVIFYFLKDDIKELFI